MSGEFAPKLRVVRCPKCRLLLPEYPQYDVYKCGGCGTTLKAKKRINVAVNSQSGTQETGAAPRNAVDLVSDDKQCSNREQLVPPGENDLKAKATSSSSGECSLDGNVGRGQNKNGECNGDLVGPFNLSDEELESELDIYKLSHRRHRLSKKGGSNKITHCEIEEINSENLLLEASKEELICASGEDGNNEKSTLVGVKSEMEIIGSDLEEAEELNNGNLLLEGAKEELLSGSDEEDANNDKSDLVVANSGMEITGNDSEGGELNRGNLLPEGAEKQLTSGSDANKDKLVLGGANPEVKIGGSDLEGPEELHDGNLSLKGAEEELISGLEGEDANNDKSALIGEKLEVEITGSNVAGEELNNKKLLLEGAKQKLNICTQDGEDADNDKSALVGENLEVEITGRNIEGEELNNGKLFEGAEEGLDKRALDGEDSNNEQSALVGAKSEVDITESASAAKRSSTETFVSEKGSILRVTPAKFEEGTSVNPVSSNKEKKHAQKNIHRSSDRVRSVDSLDTTGLINPSSKRSGILGGLHKSRTTRSYYAYDGSVSSYDGIDEQFPVQHLDSFESPYTVANDISEGRSRKGKGLVNWMAYGDHGTQHQSYLSSGKNHVKKDSRRSQKTRRHEFPPRIPFHQSGSQSCYESGSPSNQMHDDLCGSSSFLSPESHEDTDQEKMKLLRMIYKLQDQLNRTRSISREGISSKGSHIPAYDSHGIHEGRFSHGLDYHGCNGRCSHGLKWHQGHKFSRIPYSDEATSSAYHADHSCFHCCPHERHLPADLPPHVLFRHEELRGPYPGQDCCSYNHSHPSGPQWFKTSELPVYGRETKSDDQRYMAHGVKKYSTEKQNSAKRYYKPVAGGAPFITCHKCLNLLKLPVEFLHFKRVCHQLKCSECSEVLKFSLQNGNRIVSYSPNAAGPPSNDLKGQRGMVSDSRSLPSASHANYYQYTPADPISYSDDYGLSVSISCSSEGDPVSLTQFHHLHGSEYDKPSVSRGTFEPLTEKEKIASRHSTTSKASMGTGESAELSSNMSVPWKLSSEIKEKPPPKSSSLHKLMGYSSPSQVIRGTRSSAEGNSIRKCLVNLN